MRRLLGVLFLIACMLFQLSACGKQEKTIVTKEQATTSAAIAETTAAEETTVPEETKKIVETVPMIEYSLPEGEGVESAENFAEESEKETQEAVKPDETVPPIVIEKEDCGCDYSYYAKMSPAEQEAYMNTFDSPLDFIEWSKKALAEHEAHDTTIQASGGDLDLGDYIK